MLIDGDKRKEEGRPYTRGVDTGKSVVGKWRRTVAMRSVCVERK